MFISNVHGKETINNAAASIGCTAGLAGESWGAKPGLIGNTFQIKDQLKAAGARWDGRNSAWVFQDWDTLESALTSITVQ